MQLGKLKDKRAMLRDMLMAGICNIAYPKALVICVGADWLYLRVKIAKTLDISYVHISCFYLLNWELLAVFWGWVGGWVGGVLSMCIPIIYGTSNLFIWENGSLWIRIE